MWASSQTATVTEASLHSRGDDHKTAEYSQWQAGKRCSPWGKAAWLISSNSWSLLLPVICLAIS